jgi:hypothetical protein
MNDTSINIKSIAFTDANFQQGMALFYKRNNDTCFIAKTNNGGQFWTVEQFRDTTRNGKPVFVFSGLDKDNFFIATENNEIYATNDFGQK